MKKRFGFLDKSEKEISTFCEECFENFKISYELIDIPNYMMFEFKKSDTILPLKIEKNLDLNKFRRNINQNSVLFSTKSLRDTGVSPKLNKLNFKLKSFVKTIQGGIETYFE